MQHDAHDAAHGSIDRTGRKLTAAAFVVSAVIVGVAGLGGCNSECHHGDKPHCEGKTLAYSCEPLGDPPFESYRWEHDVCPVECVESGTTAFCALSATPVAACASDGPACWDGRPTTCLGGFPIGEAAPKPCAEGTHCIVAARCGQRGAFCSATDVPEPRCGGDLQAWFCDGGLLAVCKCGYVEHFVDCGGPSRCISTAGCGTYCAAADEPDPRCGGGSQGFCDGGVRTGCRCGYITYRDDCGPGLCHAVQGEVRCTGSATPDPRCGDPSRASAGFCDHNVSYRCWYGYLRPEPYDCGNCTCVQGPNWPDGVTCSCQ